MKLFKRLQDWFLNGIGNTSAEEKPCTCGQGVICPSKIYYTFLGHGRWRVERKSEEMFKCGKVKRTFKEAGKIRLEK